MKLAWLRRTACSSTQTDGPLHFRQENLNGYLRVAVLPSDAGTGEIEQLELKLQMRQEFKQDYSFTNELLFINDLSSHPGYNSSRIATELRWREADVIQHQRMLSTIRDLQKRCGSGLKLVRFDDNKREIMIELDKKLQTLEKSDPEAAERLLANRALALLTDVGYAKTSEKSTRLSLRSISPPLQQDNASLENERRRD